MIINNPNFVPFFLQDLSRCTLWHINKNIHIFTSGVFGAIAPRSQRNVKKEAIRFLHQILHTRREDISCNGVDSDSCLEVRNFFLLKCCNLAHSECPKIPYYQPKKSTFSSLISLNNKNYSPYQSLIPIQISMLA